MVLLRILETREVWHLKGRGGEDDCVDHAGFLRDCMALAEAAPRLQVYLKRSHEEHAHDFHYHLVDEKIREESAKRRREEESERSSKRQRYGGWGSSNDNGTGGY